MPTMNISQLARLAGVSVDTIRYYERQSLLAPASRSTAGYRQFDERGLRKLIDSCPGAGELSNRPIVAALSGADDNSVGTP